VHFIANSAMNLITVIQNVPKSQHEISPWLLKYLVLFHESATVQKFGIRKICFQRNWYLCSSRMHYICQRWHKRHL